MAFTGSSLLPSSNQSQLFQSSKDEEESPPATSSTGHHHRLQPPQIKSKHRHPNEPMLTTADGTQPNVLHCLVCETIFQDPRILSCYHSFCAKCIEVQPGESKINCPVCGKLTILKDGGGGPTPDYLIRHVLEKGSGENISCCANCETQGRIPMFYCNTCGQILCNGCRVETHRAKMFSAHEILPLTKYRSKDSTKKCSLHGETLLMYSLVDHRLFCIQCYRDSPMEVRLHCLDLDTAYNQGIRKLDRALMSLRDLQVSVREGITLLKNLLEELRRSAEGEKSAISAVCQSILHGLNKTEENLFRDVDTQCDGKEKVIRAQLSQLRGVLPTIRLHLSLSNSISNEGNKYDFLDYAYPLIDRLTAITHLGYPLRPSQNCQIKSSYKPEIARTLEPWTEVDHGGLQKEYSHPFGEDASFPEPTYAQYYPMSRSTVFPTSILPQHPKTKINQRKPTFKPFLLDGIEQEFAAHCRTFTTFLNELNQKLGRLKEEVQDLHRDVSLQRGGSHIPRTEAALRQGLIIEDQLNRRQTEMEKLRKVLETSWNEHMRVVRIEQEVFQSQMKDLLSLKSEVKQLSNILTQLQSFLRAFHQSQHPPPPPPPSSSAPPPTGNDGGASDSSFRTQEPSNKSLQQKGKESVRRVEGGFQVAASPFGHTKGRSEGRKESLAFGPKASTGSGRLRVGSGFLHLKSGGGSSSGSSSLIMPTASTSAKGDTDFQRRSLLNQLIQRVKPKEDTKMGSSHRGPPPPPPPRGTSYSSPRKNSIPTSTTKPTTTITTTNTPPTSMSIAAATSAIAASNRAAVRAAMYDAQVQHGNKSAVGTLCGRGVGRGSHHSGDTSERHCSGRGNGLSATSFKSKSDDERRPSKLRQESRTRSMGAMDSHHLLIHEPSPRVLNLYSNILNQEEEKLENGWIPLISRERSKSLFYNTHRDFVVPKIPSSREEVQVYVHEEPTHKMECLLSPSHPKKELSIESLISLTSSEDQEKSIETDRRSISTIRRVNGTTRKDPSESQITISRQLSWETGLCEISSRKDIPPPRSVSSTPGLPSRDKKYYRNTFGEDDDGDGEEEDDDDDEDGGRSRLQKAHSFEGHEEAVRSLVAAVQQTRSLQRKFQQTQRMDSIS